MPVETGVLSFVIPAHDEALYLPSTLRAIHAAARDLEARSEVIVVDDGSADGTADVARAGGARVIRVEHRQIAATRNAGARAACGEYLVFIDADTLVDGPVVRAAQHAMREGAVGGGAAFRFDDAAPAWAAHGMGRISDALGLFGLAAGCFLFCRRDAFEAAGGFDERYYGLEEFVLSRALARRGRFVVLEERVVTSSRKVRARSFWDVATFTASVLMPGAARRRAGLAFWYGERR